MVLSIISWENWDLSPLENYLRTMYIQKQGM